MTGEKKKMVQKVGMKIKRANVTSYLEFKPLRGAVISKKGVNTSFFTQTCATEKTFTDRRSSGN